MISVKKVAAVVVTYNNKTMLYALLKELLHQSVKLQEIIVIDNASHDGTQSLVNGAFPEIHYKRLEENTGSAGGFYEGIKLAVERNNDLIWLLDDDVTINNQAMEVLLSWLEKLEKKESIGAIRSWGKEFPVFDEPQRTTSFAWRGTLIKKEVVDSIGLPKREYFLYADDAEYALRITKKDYAIFWIPGSYCIERRTDDKQCFTFLSLETKVYENKIKLYYAFRNQVNMYLEYHSWLALLKTFAYAVKVAMVLVFFTKTSRMGKVKAVGDGIFDGLSGKLGKNEHYVMQ